MAQYEPKTDSKEFELPGVGQDSLSAAEFVADSADITIRLWQPERPAPGGSLTWRTESVLVYMIADLVTASRGRVDDTAPAMTAHFDGSGRALVAAKRIQSSILEFLACRPGDSLAAAILIHQPPTTPGGTSAVTAQGALRLAEPGQILLSAETARRLHQLPGIELQSVPALTTGGDEQAGLAELVWTSPERIARMRPSTGDGGHRESLPMGATMIVNTALGNSGQETSKTAQSVVGPAAVLAEDRSVAARSQKQERTSTSREFTTGENGAVPSGLEETGQPSFLTRTRLILGLVAVVLVGTLVWEFMPRKVAKPAVHVPETQVGTGETPAGQTPPTGGTGSTEPSVDQKVVDSTLKTPDKTPDVVVNPGNPEKSTPENSTPENSTKNKRVKGKDKGKDKQNGKQEADKPEEQPPIPGFEGLTQKDIPKLLQMARNHAGNGNYEDARREYRAILQMQPSNSDAKEGLRRLDVAQSNR